MSTDRALEAARRIIACPTLYKGDPLKAAFGCIALSEEVERMREALQAINDSFEKHKNSGAYEWVNSQELADAFDLMRDALPSQGIAR